MLYTQQDLLFSAALAIYIATSVIVAIIRWGHRCEPFARHMDYFHPAWRTIVFCFLTNLLMLPVLFLPQEADSVMALRVMIMLGSPYFCAMFLFTHFGRMVNMGNWKVSLYLLSVPFIVLVLAAIWLAIMPGTQLQGVWARQLGAVSGTMAVIFLLSFIGAFILINRARRLFSEENYSSKEDFPKNFAVHAVILSSLHILVSWGVSFIGGKDVIAIGLLILSALIVAFLLIALNPHRALDVTFLEAENRVKELAEEVEHDVWDRSEPGSVLEAQPLSASRKNEILKIVRKAVEEDKAFLDSHLTLAHLSQLCGVNRTYLSAVLTESLGGFFYYINRCRMDFANKYRDENPNASVEDLAIASGFGSRQSFYNARKQLERGK